MVAKPTPRACQAGGWCPSGCSNLRKTSASSAVKKGGPRRKKATFASSRASAVTSYTGGTITALDRETARARRCSSSSRVNSSKGPACTRKAKHVTHPKRAVTVCPRASMFREVALHCAAVSAQSQRPTREAQAALSIDLGPGAEHQRDAALKYVVDDHVDEVGPSRHPSQTRGSPASRVLAWFGERRKGRAHSDLHGNGVGLDGCPNARRCFIQARVSRSTFSLGRSPKRHRCRLRPVGEMTIAIEPSGAPAESVADV